MVIVWMFFCFGQAVESDGSLARGRRAAGVLLFPLRFSMQVGRWNMGVPIVTFILRHGLSHDF